MAESRRALRATRLPSSGNGGGSFNLRFGAPERRVPMLPEKQTRTNIGVGTGVLLQLTGLFLARTGDTAAILAGAVLFLISIPVLLTCATQILSSRSRGRFGMSPTRPGDELRRHRHVPGELLIYPRRGSAWGRCAPTVGSTRVLIPMSQSVSQSVSPILLVDHYWRIDH